MDVTEHMQSPGSLVLYKFGKAASLRWCSAWWCILTSHGSSRTTQNVQAPVPPAVWRMSLLCSPQLWMWWNYFRCWMAPIPAWETLTCTFHTVSLWMQQVNSYIIMLIAFNYLQLFLLHLPGTEVAAYTDTVMLPYLSICHSSCEVLLSADVSRDQFVKCVKYRDTLRKLVHHEKQRKPDEVTSPSSHTAEVAHPLQEYQEQAGAFQGEDSPGYIRQWSSARWADAHRHDEHGGVPHPVRWRVCTQRGPSREFFGRSRRKQCSARIPARFGGILWSSNGACSCTIGPVEHMRLGVTLVCWGCPCRGPSVICNNIMVELNNSL